MGRFMFGSYSMTYTNATNPFAHVRILRFSLTPRILGKTKEKERKEKERKEKERKGKKRKEKKKSNAIEHGQPSPCGHMA